MISVIVPTYNKADYLELTLASFSNQTFKEFELVILDDGSSDHTEDVVKSFEKNLNINYSKQKNQGHSKARNEAVKISKFNLLIFIDDDRLVNPEFIEEHYKLLKEDTQNIIVGSRKRILSKWVPGNNGIKRKELFEFMKKNKNIINLKSSNSQFIFNKDEVSNNFSGVINNFELKEKESKFDKIIEEFYSDLSKCYFLWLYGSGGNFSCSKESYIAIEGYDEGFVGWGIEDTDVLYRFYLNNLRFIYAENAVNYHQVHPRSIDKTKLDKNINYFVNKYGTEEMNLYLKYMNDQIDIREANEMLREMYEEKMYNKKQRLYDKLAII